MEEKKFSNILRNVPNNLYFSDHIADLNYSSCLFLSVERYDFFGDKLFNSKKCNALLHAVFVRLRFVNFIQRQVQHATRVFKVTLKNSHPGEPYGLRYFRAGKCNCCER